MNWNDAEDIALALMDAHPGINPLSVRYTQLLEWIMELDGFDGDRA
jgi:FeS assembly protein IscX